MQVGIFLACWTRRLDSTKQTSGAGFSEAWIIEARKEQSSAKAEYEIVPPLFALVMPLALFHMIRRIVIDALALGDDCMQMGSLLNAV